MTRYAEQTSIPSDAYPLTWPAGFARTAPGERQRARFGKAGDSIGRKPLTVAQARDRLMAEIDRFTKPGQPWRINPAEVVISSDVPVRKDGLPASGRLAPDDPGVAVYLWLDGEPHVFPCDAWDRVADNIAAVAAHLGALRGIERWGVGDLRQAFTGWRALPDPESAGGRSWREVLGVPADAGPEAVRSAYMRRRREAHPDNGGTPSEFHAVQVAWEQAQSEIGRSGDAAGAGR